MLKIILLLLALIFGGHNMTLNESDRNEMKETNQFNKSSLYVSNQLHFTLEIPSAWQGKYEVTETSNEVSFTYKPEKSFEKGFIFKIYTALLSDWNDHGKDLPYAKIGERNGIVYMVITSSENPYGYNPNDLDSKGYQEIMNSNNIEKVLKSFKLVD